MTTESMVLTDMAAHVERCRARIEAALKALDDAAGELHRAYCDEKLAREALASETAMRREAR